MIGYRTCIPTDVEWLRGASGEPTPEDLVTLFRQQCGEVTQVRSARHLLNACLNIADCVYVERQILAHVSNDRGCWFQSSAMSVRFPLSRCVSLGCFARMVRRRALDED